MSMVNMQPLFIFHPPSSIFINQIQPFSLPHMIVWSLNLHTGENLGKDSDATLVRDVRD